MLFVGSRTIILAFSLRMTLSLSIKELTLMLWSEKSVYLLAKASTPVLLVPFQVIKPDQFGYLSRP